MMNNIPTPTPDFVKGNWTDQKVKLKPHYAIA